MQILSTSQYDGLLRVALRQRGIPDDLAERLIASRWPMPAAGLIGESYGRGFVVDLQTIKDWLASVVGSDCWEDGEPLDPANVLVTPRLADSFLRWAVAHRRVRLTDAGEMFQRDPKPGYALIRAGKALEN